VSPFTDAGAAVPAHHTGSLEASTPALSRTDAVFGHQRRDVCASIMRMVRMSPKNAGRGHAPIGIRPTAMQPDGIFLDGAPASRSVSPSFPARRERSSRTGNEAQA